MDELKEEMEVSQTFNDFKNKIADGIQDINAFEELRTKEKTYNDEIKYYTEELKKKNEESIAEQQQS